MTVNLIVEMEPSGMPPFAVSVGAVQNFEHASLWIDGFDLYLHSERKTYQIKKVLASQERTSTA